MSKLRSIIVRTSRAEAERLAAEQSALRRVAEAVARRTPSDQVFALVTEELSRLLDADQVRVVRFEPDRTVTVLASLATAQDRLGPGTNMPLPSGTVVERIFRTGAPARVEDYAQVPGPVGDMLREEGVQAAAGGPIVLDGHLWGAMVVTRSNERALPPVAEDRVAQFAELVSTAISNVESQAKVAQLAAEQSALRRVAELVAQRASPEDVFALVAEELSRLLGVDMVRTVRFEPNGTATVLASQGRLKNLIPVGMNFGLPRRGVVAGICRTGLPTWDDKYVELGSPIGDLLRREGVSVAAGGPIVVDGRLWGAMVASASTVEALPSGSEGRIAQFAELVSTAISNIESRAKVEQLAAEQSALRRVAEPVARQAPADEVFALVTEELGRIMGVDIVKIVRFEPDGSATVLATYGITDDRIPQGRNGAIERGSLIDTVVRTGGSVRVDDYAQVEGPVGAILCDEGVRCGVGAPLMVDGHLWGAMAILARTPGAFLPDAESRVIKFCELISTGISNIESRAKVERLAAEQAALRRVAELVGRQAPPEEVFGLVTEELNGLLDVTNVGMARFEPDDTALVLAVRGTAQDAFPAGKKVLLTGGSMIEHVFRTGRAAHVEHYKNVGGELGPVMRELGAGWAAAGPIVIDGRLWGAMVVNSSSGEAYPAGAEERVAQFAELVSTAISNVESRARIERLAAEQSALRRVASLVAGQHSAEELFATLAKEVGVLLEVDAAAIFRYEPDSTATVVAGWSDGPTILSLGKRFPLEGENLDGEVQSNGKARNKEAYEAARIAATVRQLGLRAAVASPIVVEGVTWGVIAVLARRPKPLPSDTEARLAEFSHHAGVAVANAKSRSDLSESRARIVRAADEARRRFERDLHDGAQQRLVSLELELRGAEVTVPPELGGVRRVLSAVATGLRDVVDDLRELSRGLHPAVLAEGGLGSAMRALARRSAVPVELRLDLGEEPLGELVEVAAYYVASEALTNTAKHANASRAEVLGTHHDGWLELTVRDDGKGGANPSSGTGLTGLFDRVEAIGGTIQIDSPPDAGTAVRVRLPIRPTR